MVQKELQETQKIQAINEEKMRRLNETVKQSQSQIWVLMEEIDRLTRVQQKLRQTISQYELGYGGGGIASTSVSASSNNAVVQHQSIVPITSSVSLRNLLKSDENTLNIS